MESATLAKTDEEEEQVKLTERHRPSSPLILVDMIQVHPLDLVLVLLAQPRPRVPQARPQRVDRQVPPLDPIVQHPDIFVRPPQQCDLRHPSIGVLGIHAPASLPSDVPLPRPLLLVGRTRCDRGKYAPEFLKAKLERVTALLFGGLVRGATVVGARALGRLEARDGRGVEAEEFGAAAFKDILVVALGRKARDSVGGEACRGGGEGRKKDTGKTCCELRSRGGRYGKRETEINVPSGRSGLIFGPLPLGPFAMFLAPATPGVDTLPARPLPFDAAVAPGLVGGCSTGILDVGGLAVDEEATPFEDDESCPPTSDGLAATAFFVLGLDGPAVEVE